jgi:predicted trehalose synthase
MDDRTVLPSWQDLGTAGRPEDGPVVVHRYRLGLETAVSVRSDGEAWWCVPERAAGGNVAAEEWVEADEGDGAAQAFVDLLLYAELPSVPGFRVVRLAPPPEADVERRVDADTGLHSSVVVGERVVVAWTRRVVDAAHPGALTLQHLAALDFMGVPEVYGLLLWRTPGGHEVPVATATRYLPRSRDGWSWAADLVDVAAGLADAPAPVGTPPGGIDLSGVDLPARLGRLVAKLHVALATPSDVDAAPAGLADAATVLGWHAEARSEVEAASEVLLGVGLPDGAGGRGLDAHDVPVLLAAVDGLQLLARDVEDGRAQVTVQRVHGDLHVGRVLRWTRGLAVVGFDAEASFAPTRGGGPSRNVHQPAARDLARLLASLADVATRAASRPEMPAETPRAWYRQAREQVAAAYRAELEAEKRPELLDERLLTAFDAAEHARALLARLAAAAASDAEPSPLG